MTNHVPLDTIDHADLVVAVRHEAAFGDSVNQLPVFPTEFEQLQRHYPIFFRKDETHGFYAVVLLGLDRDENLFLKADGWDADYIPAIQRRGPFVEGPLADDGTGARGLAVQVDLDDPRVGAAGGVPLFLRHGGTAPYLDHISAVLDAIRHGRAAVRPTFDALVALDLIRPVSLDLRLDDGDVYVVPDLHTIDEEKLAALSGDALDRLHKSGILRAATMAASSVGNVRQLIARKNQRKAGR